MAKAIEKIRQLEAKDPVRAWLYTIGIGLTVVGIAFIVLHFVWLKIGWGDDAGMALLTVGVACTALGRWLVTVQVAVMVLLLAAGTYAAWRAWRKYRKQIAGAVSPALSEAEAHDTGA